MKSIIQYHMRTIAIIILILTSSLLNTLASGENRDSVTINAYLNTIINSPSDSIKIQENEKLKKHIHTLLETPESFEYDFGNIKNIGSVY